MSGMIIDKPESRQYDCQEYDNCLARAAKKNRLRLGCRKCTRYKPSEYRPVQHDMEGILLLMVKLYGGAPSETARLFWNTDDGHAVSEKLGAFQEAG